MALVLGWIFLHLLLCDVSNQSTSSLEDEANKPYRPIPSGRLSDEAAKRLLVVLYGVCLLVSYYLDLLQCSFILGLLAFGYNTLDMSRALAGEESVQCCSLRLLRVRRDVPCGYALV